METISLRIGEDHLGPRVQPSPLAKPWLASALQIEVLVCFVFLEKAVLHHFLRTNGDLTSLLGEK